MIKLYSYWRSSTSYRVRIALALKNIHYQLHAVDLLAAEQTSSDYLSVNPSASLPALQLRCGQVLTQSLAIIEYLDQLKPTPPLLPAEPRLRARVQAAAQVIACDIHLVNNSKVIKYLQQLGHTGDTTRTWAQQWTMQGLQAFNALIDGSGEFCFGDQLTLADVCLVPQMYNARRWGIDASTMPRLAEIESRCLQQNSFLHAHPDAQPDAETSNADQKLD